MKLLFKLNILNRVKYTSKIYYKIATFVYVFENDLAQKYQKPNFAPEISLSFFATKKT